MFGLRPVSALAILAILAVLGGSRLGRPLRDDEKERFAALLREHDYPGARLVALRFAIKLWRDRQQAEDLMGRVELRLVRVGWNPAEVSLVKRLCRLAWSEWTHSRAETAAARRAEEAFLRDREATGVTSEPPAEERVAEQETRVDAQARASAQLARLRASFEAAGDEVNLLWLGYALQEETDLEDLQGMARRSGRDAKEFYAAAKRRKRAVQRLLTEERGKP
jgi:hypothetical protein